MTETAGAQSPANPALRRPGKFLPLLPARMRRQLRPKLWQEIAFILISYFIYSQIRDAVPTHERLALLRRGRAHHV